MLGSETTNVSFPSLIIFLCMKSTLSAFQFRERHSRMACPVLGCRCSHQVIQQRNLDWYCKPCKRACHDGLAFVKRRDVSVVAAKVLRCGLNQGLPLRCHLHPQDYLGVDVCQDFFWNKRGQLGDCQKADLEFPAFHGYSQENIASPLDYFPPYHPYL